MKEEKQKAQAIDVKGSRFLSWLDNFWYHHKWTTLVAAFLVIVFAVCIIQSCTAKSSDLTVTYAGRVLFTASDKEAVEGVISDRLPDGYSEDASAEMIAYYILSKEQIETMEKETHADGEAVYVDRAFISSEKEKFMAQLQTTTSSILLVEPWLYRELVGNNESTEIIKSLDEIFGETPVGALDSYGIRLGDTEMYKTNPELKCLPEDTVLCLVEKRLWQKSKEYEREMAAFKSFAKLSPAEEASNG